MCLKCLLLLLLHILYIFVNVRSLGHRSDLNRILTNVLYMHAMTKIDFNSRQRQLQHYKFTDILKLHSAYLSFGAGFTRQSLLSQ